MSNFCKYLECKSRVPKWYYVGSRKGQILHCKLRLKCSSLKLHLFQKNLVDNPLCQCGQVESIDHFLLRCRLFSDLRQATIHSLQYNLNTDLLLYGDNTLSFEQNCQIFSQVQTFLLRSKRFSTQL